MSDNEILMVAKTPEDIGRILQYLDNPDFDFVAVDTETTGLEEDCEMTGFSIAAEKEIGIYVVFSEWISNVHESDCEVCFGVGSLDMGMTKAGHPKKRKQCKACKTTGTVKVYGGELVRYPEMVEASRPVFDILLTKRLIMHNSPFDVKVTRREMGIDLMPALHTDTMELSHVLDENEYAGLKEIASRFYGADATAEKEEMKASVLANGGRWEESKKPGSVKEMYKADCEILARYGAKDTILTLRIFHDMIDQLFAENLDDFFYNKESMPLMKTATYHLNSTGLKVDVEKLKQLELEMSDNCTKLKREIEELIQPLVLEKYPKGFGAKKPGAFNINSSQQLAWLLFSKCAQPFTTLTKGGKLKAREFIGKVPYDNRAKREFIDTLEANEIVPWKYMQCDKATLEVYEKKYDWCAKLLEFRSELKLLNTYVLGIKARMKYGIIYPGFLQHGTTSGRYSSVNPNFQNLPRDDKRVKSMIIARPGRIFVGADYSQLEPRVFASVSQDERLMASFDKGWDFYAVIGVELYQEWVDQWEERHPGEKVGLKKKDPNFFGAEHMHPEGRQTSKTFCLASPYGTSAFQQSQKLKKPQKWCQAMIDMYFEKFPSVHQMMLNAHETVKRDGVVYNLYGRPRRIPDGKSITRIYGNLPHGELPYEARTLLNLGVNHTIQSSAATIVNRACIAFHKRMQELGLDARIVLQVHDEIIVECREEDVEVVQKELRHAMEYTTELPGVVLVAEPKAAYKLSDLK